MNEININDYVLIGQPDKSLMTDIINSMKGKDRSMADFAIETGLSTSMLSRIVNGNYSKPIGVDVLQKIAACKAKDCPLDLDNLLAANGMQTQAEAARSAIRHSQHRFSEQRRRRRKMREIITDELFARGVAIKKLGVPEKAEMKPSKAFFGARVCDLAITLPDEDEYIEWGFSMISITKDDDADKDYPEYYIKRVIDNYAVIFLEDAWDPESSKHTKYSFGFADPYYFTLFIEALQIARFNNRMSAILIDIDSKTVVKEYMFPCKNFPKEKSLFEKKGLQEDELRDEDVLQFTFFEDYHEG